MAVKNSFEEIPLESITGAALDRGLLHLRMGEQYRVLRLTEWNPFQASPRKTQQDLQMLRGQNIPTFSVQTSVAKFPVARTPVSHENPIWINHS